MGRREQARAEARFHRGEVGVDGRSTSEAEAEVDPQLKEQKQAREQLLRGGTWLGRELLTWLLYRSDGGEPVTELEGRPLEVRFLGRMLLRGVHGEVVELSARGALAPYSVHVRRALHSGLLVHQARLQLVWADRVFEATVDAEFLDPRSARLPALLTEEEDDRLSERLELSEQLSAMLDSLLAAFLEVRTSRAWKQRVVPELRAWMEG